MKVLHIEGGTHVYGGAYQVLQLLRLLKGRGEHFLACPEGSDVAAEALKAGIEVLPIPLNGEASLPSYFALRAIIKERKPDIVHVHSRRGADVWGVLAAWRSGTKLIVTRRVDNPEPRWLARLRYAPATRVVGISEKIRAVLASEGVPEGKLRCIRSGVDTAAYTPCADRGILKAEFGIGDDEKTVLMAAQFIRRKGHATLLAAIPGILEKCPKTRFLLAGQGPLLAEVRAAAAEFGDRVIVPGFRSDLAKILPACTLLAHPAESEGLGVVILQAAACGVPVVASRAGGIPEVVCDGQSGFLVEPGNVRQFALRIASLLADDTLAAEMGRHARDYAVNELSIDATAKANHTMYSELVPG